MIMTQPRLSLCLLVTALVLPQSSVLAVDYPVGLTNCGISNWIPKAPQRAVTLNQGTTEVMLALGLADSMVGTAYLDDEIWPELAAEYAKVPVISEFYPKADELMALQPDFLYGSYSSAFSSNSINYTNHLNGVDECNLTVTRSNGSNRTFCRQELHDEGIDTYLQEPFCELVEHRPTETTMQVLLDEIWDIATVFGILGEARVLIDGIEDHFTQARAVVEAADTTDAGPKIKVLWLDSWDPETPYVGACCGAVQVILEHAGAQNIFENLGVEEKSSWKSAPWTDVEKFDPDLIVLVDASWDTADEKLNHLCQHNITRNLRAVKNRAFLIVPFSGSTLGVRVGSLAYNMAEAMVALARNTPLPALEFTDVTTAVGSRQAVAKSGLKVYTKFPVFNNTNLDETCPGSADNFPLIRDIPPVQQGTSNNNDNDKLPDWAIVLIAVLGVGLAAILAFMAFMVSREKTGNPMFQPVKEMT